MRAERILKRSVVHKLLAVVQVCRLCRVIISDADDKRYRAS
jgi:hypothetical protein